ncbi:predicted protein [Streptomyces viridosporus ATCC 14672]|uniref:Predicted protein n=1 Tax=Streptomyces viridosporus (strain ATCC 14672 / DSM 40746 / JCM 4963 / KCTC 9882 / NRRL B-12104 / FH 1290) TaxID=566461 RepID=D5ZR13_STRV1|nr:hypothetical protein [Streptomyces viridosporus]EFE68404.1 predicted protein [Streptomyces viridosporus ATCC 14672]
MTEITLMPVPEVAAVPVQECGGRLVDVRRERHVRVRVEAGEATRGTTGDVMFLVN